MRALRSKSSVSNTTTKVRKDLNLSRLTGKLASLFYCPADPLVKAAAYLHDTVEDTGTTIDTIRAEFPQEVAEAVSVLTREKDMTYAEYIWRVKQNDILVIA